MAAERGGRADKFGNRYEGYWVARQLLFVLRGEYQSVVLEGLGDDEVGVDLWITHTDGTREAQQCKSGNRLQGKWSIADLHSRGVLTSIDFQLKRNSAYRFTFVSSIPAPELKSLVDRASSSNNNPELFYNHQIKPYKNHLEPFRNFCHYLGLDSKIDADRAKSYNYLQRTNVHLFESSHQGKEDIKMWASMLVEGDSQTVIEVLAGLAQDNLGNELYIDDITRCLKKAELKPRNLSLDSNLSNRIEELQKEFASSLQATLINKTLIPRDEAKELIEKLGQGKPCSLIVLHGRKGRGKSTVLLELVQHLYENNIPYLPIRLDRRPPQISAKRFGVDSCDLPESPCVCLASIAGNRHAVLILDQLDAIRWTSRHAAANWETIKEVINQAVAHPHLSVVVACRTFDLNTDPLLKAWHEESSNIAIEVKLLSDQKVQEIVQHSGYDYNKFSKRQKELLRSSDCLYLWTIIHQDKEVPVYFNTNTELMREFIEDRKKELEKMGVSLSECNSLLEKLIKLMDQEGKLHVHVRHLRKHVKEAEALQSVNLISISESRVTFSHQSYYEYLLAEHVVDDIESEKQTILKWVGEDQPLMLREQLRQILTILRDGNANYYFIAIEQLLQGNNVRYHLKLLVIQFLGYCEQPRLQETDLILKLLEQDEWREQIVSCFSGNADWFDVFDNRSVICNWLSSSDAKNVSNACWLLRNSAKYRGDRIAEILNPYISNDNAWMKRIASIIPHDPIDDTRNLFNLRLNLIKSGYLMRVKHSHDIKHLSQKEPLWCIDLIEAKLHRMELEIRDKSKIDRAESYFEENYAIVAEKEPNETWDRLFPLVESIAELSSPDYDDAAPFQDDNFWGENHYPREGIQFIKNAIISAGCRMAVTDRSGFFKRVNTYSISKYRTTQLILYDIFLLLPDEFADIAINWLCGNSDRMRMHQPLLISEYALARKLIAKFTPICSDTAYNKIESTILTYRNESEWESFHSTHNRRMGGEYLWPNEFGRPRQALLTGLPQSRMSCEALNTLGQLNRKFGEYEIDSEHSDYSAHSVSSPISGEKRTSISNKHWLGIINNTISGKDVWKRRKGKDGYIETSPELFANDLREATKKFPKRFATLALHFPKNIDPLYRTATLNALAECKLSEQNDNYDDSTSEKITEADIVQVLRHFGYSDYTYQAIGYCRIIEKHANIVWPDDVLKNLILYATKHPHPSPEQLTVRGVKVDDERHIRNIENSSINCVRGCAANAIVQLLASQPSLYGFFESSIAQLINDPNSAVRIAAIRTCLPLLSINREMAVQSFIRACECADDCVLACRHVDLFLAHACWTHIDQLQPIIFRMVNSQNKEVAKKGAARTTAAHLQFDKMRDTLHLCLNGDVQHRKGVAEVASQWIIHEEHKADCVKLLLLLFNDDDHNVQRKASYVFNKEDILKSYEGKSLADAYVDSNGFIADPSTLLYALEHYSDSIIELKQIIFNICEKFAGPLKEASQDLSTHIAGTAQYIPTLVLRLYEQAEEREDRVTKIKCLDTFDLLLSSGVGGSMNLLEELDR